MTPSKRPSPASERLPANVVRFRDGYRARFRRHGRTVYSKVVPTIDAAVRLRDAMRSWQPGAGIFTLSEAMTLKRQQLARKGAAAATVDYYEQQFATLLEAWSAETALIRIDRQAVEAFVDHRQNVHRVGNATVAKNLVTLSGLFRLAIKRRDETGILTNPVDELDVKPQFRAERYDALTPADAVAMAERIRQLGQNRSLRYRNAEADADLIELAALTGLRRAELERLTVNDLDAQARVARVVGKRRTESVPLSARAVELLERMIARARLAGREHLVHGDDRLRRIRRLDQLLHTWKDRLGMTFRGGWHALRHGVGTALVEAGVREQDAQTVLRHATPQMTRHYYHARESNIRAAVDALDPRTATPKRRKGAR